MLFIRYTWPAIIWSMFILIATLIPGESVPEVDVADIDKLVHFFLFAMVMILSSYGLKRFNEFKASLQKPVFIAIVYSVSFGAMIEVLQIYIPGRSFSFTDIAANTTGIAVGYLLFLFMVKRSLV